MKAIKLLGILGILLIMSSALFASTASEEGGIEISRYAIFRYFRDTRLKDEAFEFYFSIDTCREMVEYIRITYPYQSVRQGFDYLDVSSDNGAMKLALGNAWSIEEKKVDGKKMYMGIYDDTIKDIYESLEFIEILKGDNLNVVLSDKSGNVMNLKTDSKGCYTVASEHTEQRDSFSKVW